MKRRDFVTGAAAVAGGRHLYASHPHARLGLGCGGNACLMMPRSAGRDLGGKRYVVVLHG